MTRATRPSPAASWRDLLARMVEAARPHWKPEESVSSDEQPAYDRRIRRAMRPQLAGLSLLDAIRLCAAGERWEKRQPAQGTMTTDVAFHTRDMLREMVAKTKPTTLAESKARFRAVLEWEARQVIGHDEFWCVLYEVLEQELGRAWPDMPRRKGGTS